MDKPLSIIVPVFNEELGIKNTVEELDKVLNQLPKGSEVIYINDGSQDKTRYILEELKTRYQFKLVSHVTNTGYGASLKTGIKSSINDLIMITDADGTYPNNRILEFSSAMEEGISMVVGARTGKNAKIQSIRKPAKWFIRQLASFLSERKIPDLNSGMRLMKKDVVLEFINMLPNGFSFTTTITLAMLVNGYQVKYISIDYYQREGKSKIKPIRDTLNFINLIIITVFAFQPNKFFTPLTIVTFLIFLVSIVVDLVNKDFTDSTVIALLIFFNTLSLNIISSIIAKKR